MKKRFLNPQLVGGWLAPVNNRTPAWNTCDLRVGNFDILGPLKDGCRRDCDEVVGRKLPQHGYANRKEAHKLQCGVTQQEIWAVLKKR